MEKNKISRSFQRFKKYASAYFVICRSMLKDPRAPLSSKALLALAIGYTFMPFDFIPDFIPFAGQIDDIIVIPALIYLALKMLPKDAYEEYAPQLFPDKEKTETA
jgi:uncharacterized membrane protein YkvA (DUF1232 family)